MNLPWSILEIPSILLTALFEVAGYEEIQKMENLVAYLQRRKPGKQVIRSPKTISPATAPEGDEIEALVHSHDEHWGQGS